MKKHQMGWGNPFFLMEMMKKRYNNPFYNVDINALTYGPYDGEETLIQQTREVMQKCTGFTYKHVIMTNGASHAVSSILRDFKRNGGANVHTCEYGYPSYKDIIELAGLNRVRSLENVPAHHDTMSLIESPENPTGKQYIGVARGNDIWDAVYHNHIYTHNLSVVPGHDYHVGSYSKLLGLPGVRVGWIATDNTLAYNRLQREILNDLVGLSKLSQWYVSDILEHVDLDDFMSQGHWQLNDNRDLFSKIEYFFDEQPINEVGMFYCPKVSDGQKRFLDQISVEYIVLDSETIRLNMGQTRDNVRVFVNDLRMRDGK